MLKRMMAIASLSMVLGGVALADDAKKEPPPAGDTKKAAGDITAEIKAGTGVEKFEIAGEGTTFAAGTTVFVWSRVLNAEGSIKHVWKHDGQAVWTATLPVGSKRWATQSRRAIAKAGAWEVEVQTADGATIGSVAFTVN